MTNTVTVKELTHFINGAPTAGTSNRFGDVYNPSTGEVIAEYHSLHVMK